MTTSQMSKEILYHASLSPFKSMLEKGVISKEDYRVIDTVLRAKYSPLFVYGSYQIVLDNKRN